MTLPPLLALAHLLSNTKFPKTWILRNVFSSQVESPQGTLLALLELDAMEVTDLSLDMLVEN